MAMSPKYHNRHYESHEQNAYDTLTDRRVAIKSGIFIGAPTAAAPGYVGYVGGYAAAVQRAATTAGFLTGFTTNLYGEQVMAGYDWSTQSMRSQEINPLDQRFVTDKLDYVNLAAAATDVYFDMNGFQYVGVQLDFDAALGVGVTFWVSKQDDGTAPASCFYTDVTFDWFGTTIFNADAALLKDTPTSVKYLRIRFDNTGGAATEDLRCFIKRMY